MSACVCGVQLNSKKSVPKNGLGVTPAKISKLKLIVLKFMHFVRDKGESPTRGRGTFVTFAFCGSFGVVIHPRREGGVTTLPIRVQQSKWISNVMDWNKMSSQRMFGVSKGIKWVIY